MASVMEMADRTRVRGHSAVALGGALAWPANVAVAVCAVVGFHLAQWLWGGFVLLFLYGVIRLAELSSTRKAFYTAVAVGYAAYAPHVTFLWIIFGGAAVVLWGVLAVWLAIFVVLARSVRRHWGAGALVLLAPWLWLGTEYFRSEMYYLRFSWLSVGYSFSEAPGVVGAAGLGIYGTGAWLMAVAALAAWVRPKHAVLTLLAGAALLAGIERVPREREGPTGHPLKVAGVQMEFPSVREVTVALEDLVRRYPETELIVLSEYTFLGPIPEELLAWCKQEGRYLVVGGQDPIDETRYYNTAFVIGPMGDVVFRQVKSVPIQFFRDGEPATNQAVWESPWGRLGIAICYDLSYRRVIDGLVAAGAEALIVPVMDVVEWGIRQRELHGRVGPVRAVEYGLPIFRLCSSGISQIIDRDGHVLARGSYPGAGEVVNGELRLEGAGRLPWDAWLGPMGVWVTVAVTVGLALMKRTADPGPAARGIGGGTEEAKEW